MTALIVLHPLIDWLVDPGGDPLDRLVYPFMWWGMSMIPGIAAMVARLVLDKRLTGMARWFGWVPPVGCAAGIVALAVFGHVVG